MRLYNCVVNVGQQHKTTVPKINVTAPEILLLRAIHGNDEVTDIRRGRMDKRSHAAEYQRLHDIYGGAKTHVDPESNDPAIPVMFALFGPPMTARLPLELSGDYPFINEKVAATEPVDPAEPERKVG